jgi:hypothetical protein
MISELAEIVEGDKVYFQNMRNSPKATDIPEGDSFRAWGGLDNAMVFVLRSCEDLEDRLREGIA